MSNLIEQPLSAILDAIETRINERIALSSTATAMLADLTGKSLAVSISGPGIRVVTKAGVRELQIYTDENKEVDAEISGSPFSLMQLLGDDPEAVIRSRQVDISGDTDVIEAFQDLFEFAKPELEEELSQVIGDSAARQVTLVANDLKSWMGGLRKTFGRSTADYLKEESQQLPAVAEINEFYKEVDELTEAVDRAEARLQKYRRHTQGQQKHDAS
jgi:ubiquinone biosynthesis protein UbiJ